MIKNGRIFVRFFIVNAQEKYFNWICCAWKFFLDRFEIFLSKNHCNL